uniref:NADH dehydrogenase subunit 3 n=1 Tax=Panagrolaimus sp. JU765 TaxID=591449 RepID=A0AC34R5C2_9BILA
MCGWTDPEDEIEVDITLKGRELVIFTIFYTFAVIFLLAVFEIIMPVSPFFIPDSYPFYNHQPNWTWSET